MDRNQERANERATQFGCKNYKSPEEMVKDPAIDAVFVLTNLESHLEYTKLALDHGKHVLVEKPVGVSCGGNRTDEGRRRMRRAWCACRDTTTSTKVSMVRTKRVG